MSFLAELLGPRPKVEQPRKPRSREEVQAILARLGLALDTVQVPPTPHSTVCEQPTEDPTVATPHETERDVQANPESNVLIQQPKRRNTHQRTPLSSLTARATNLT